MIGTIMVATEYVMMALTFFKKLIISLNKESNLPQNSLAKFFFLRFFSAMLIPGFMKSKGGKAIWYCHNVSK